MLNIIGLLAAYFVVSCVLITILFINLDDNDE
jgi:hypothetical protein